MKQSKTASMTEAIINTLAGFGISLAAQWYFLPLLGVSITFHQNLLFAVIMTCVSIGRTFVLRRVFEALHIRVPMSPAMLAVIAERRRQIDAEGWTPEHDDAHAPGELARAGGAYARKAGSMFNVPPHEWAAAIWPPNEWPWDASWWKPQGFRRDLVRAGALIVAEIERFDRQRRRRPAKPLDLAAMRRSAENLRSGQL